jgi:predicted TIM-barrel fold metal-dependent hydrolase
MTRERHDVSSQLFGSGPLGRPATMNRRHFLGGAAALAVSATGFAPKLPAQARPHRIDVHHHISPPTWLDAVQRAKLDFPPAVNWSAQQSIEDMDKGGVATSIASPTMPHVGFLGAEDAARIARESNEYARKLMADHRGRFGMWAILPMPHVDPSLREIEYAFDVLKADGIAMMTSYGDKWLGYPEFAPVFEELNRRKATVYTHPNRANCCFDLVQGIPPAVVEFGADTTRTIASLIFSGSSQRCPDINFIFSHGGGALTAVVERFQDYMVRTYKDKFTRESVDRELRRFYYDTAQISNAVTIEALVKLVPISQVVFGTDYPFRTSAEHVKGLTTLFSGEDLMAIDRGNALRILPRLRNA